MPRNSRDTRTKPHIYSPIKEITTAEIEEYFKFRNSKGGAVEYSEEQTRVIGDGFWVNADGPDFVQWVLGMLLSHGPGAAFSTVWIGAFQHGREFENRLMAKAMREGK